MKVAEAMGKTLGELGAKTFFGLVGSDNPTVVNTRALFRNANGFQILVGRLQTSCGWTPETAAMRLLQILVGKLQTTRTQGTSKMHHGFQILD